MTKEATAMAMVGRTPKEDRSQVRHRNPVAEWTEVPDVPFEGHLLPERWVNRGGAQVRAEWPAATVRWWSVVRRMPHAKLWTASDWEYAFLTAEVHARYSEGGAGATELRIREGNMGVTAEDRRKLRIRYVTPSTASKAEKAKGGDPRAAAVVQLDDFRDMYGESS